MHGKAYYRPMSAKKGEENIIVASWQQSNSFSCSKFQAYYHIQEVRTIRLIGYHKLMIGLLHIWANVLSFPHLTTCPYPQCVPIC